MFSLDLSLVNGNMKSGSMGFSLKNLPVRISIQNSEDSSLKIKTSSSLISAELLNNINKICNLFEKQNNIKPNIEIAIALPKQFRHHTGLGLTTQILGGLVYLLYDFFELDFSIDSLLHYNIGAVSALGSQLIFNPGWIIEKGYRKDSSGKSLHPEFYAYGETFEKHIDKFEAPGWFAIIAIPKDGESLSAEPEEEFWRNIFPDNSKNSFDIIYEVFMNLAPAIKELDFTRFINTLNIITSVGTKPFEEKIQNNKTKEALSILRKEYGFASISSLGPTIYSFSKNDKNTPKIDGFEIIAIDLGGVND